MIPGEPANLHQGQNLLVNAAIRVWDLMYVSKKPALEEVFKSSFGQGTIHILRILHILEGGGVGGHKKPIYFLNVHTTFILNYIKGDGSKLCAYCLHKRGGVQNVPT